MRGLDLVWESATPTTHIWERYPKKKLFLAPSLIQQHFFFIRYQYYMTRRFDTDDYSNLYWGVSFTTFGVYAFGPEGCTIHYCNIIYNGQYKIATKIPLVQGLTRTVGTLLGLWLDSKRKHGFAFSRLLVCTLGVVGARRGCHKPSKALFLPFFLRSIKYQILFELLRPYMQA